MTKREIGLTNLVTHQAPFSVITCFILVLRVFLFYVRTYVRTYNMYEHNDHLFGRRGLVGQKRDFFRKGKKVGRPQKWRPWQRTASEAAKNSSRGKTGRINRTLPTTTFSGVLHTIAEILCPVPRFPVTVFFPWNVKLWKYFKNWKLLHVFCFQCHVWKYVAICIRIYTKKYLKNDSSGKIISLNRTTLFQLMSSSRDSLKNKS